MGSRVATAARTATVLPAPTSPHSTPRVASATQKPMRATASAWAWRVNRSRAAMRLVNGVRVKPKWAIQEARVLVGASSGGVTPLVAAMVVVMVMGPP